LLLDSFLSLHAQQQHYSKLKRVLTLPHAFYIRARVVPRFLSHRDSRDICLQIPMGCSFPFLWNSPGLRGFSIPDPRAASRNSTPAENSDIKLKGHGFRIGGQLQCFTGLITKIAISLLPYHNPGYVMHRQHTLY